MAHGAESGPSPFTPGSSKPPRVFGGHENDLHEITTVFETLDFGENDSLLISGLRGSGKTSMLSRLQDAARRSGWIVLSDDASKGLLTRITESSIPREINRLTPATRMRLSSVGLWNFSASFEFVDRSLAVKPLLRDDLIALSSALDGNAGILITVDEVSSGKARLRELSRFSLEIAHAKEEGANIRIAFAGIKVDLDGLVKNDHTTFIRRSRDLDFRRLTPRETAHVLDETARIAGRSIGYDSVKWPRHDSFNWPHPRLAEGVATATTGPTLEPHTGSTEQGPQWSHEWNSSPPSAATHASKDYRSGH